MSELTIDSLPEKVLIQIFKLLDLKTLKEVVLTCKKWRDVAEQSIPWSLNLFLDYKSDAQIFKESETFLASNRKYTTVIAEHLRVDDVRVYRKEQAWIKRTMDIFERIGPNIATLHLYRCYFDNIGDSAYFFNLMKNVEKLIFIKSRSSIGEIEAQPKPSDFPSFPKLKELDSIWSNNEILELFKKAELESLKIINDGFGDEPLKRFLATQKSLKTLALRSFGYPLFCDPIIPDEDIPFKLTELSLGDVKLDKSPNSLDNLLTFMCLHRTTIKKLELSSTLPESIFEHVFAMFKNLKSLRLRADMMPTNTEFFDRLEDNESVTTFTLVGRPVPSISRLFKHLPNIEHIELLEECHYQTLKSIAENLKKLKHLKVKSFDSYLFGDLNFPTIKSLSIESVGGIEWKLFAKQAPNITHFFIKDLGYNLGISKVNIKKIMESFKVESLTINSDVLGDDELFAVIRKHGSSLKSLSLSSRSLVTKERSTEVANVQGLSFHEYPVEDPLSTGNGAWNEKSFGGVYPNAYFDEKSTDCWEYWNAYLSASHF